MKKVIAIICATAMLFTFAVSAGAADLDFFDKEYKSYDATLEFSMQLNKPFDFVKVVADEAQNDTIDYQRFFESLMKATYTADVQAETSADYMSAKVAVAVSANVPIELSEDLTIAVGTKVRMWIEYDFSDENNLKYNIIVTNPLNGKYYYIDYIKLLDTVEGGEEAKALIRDMMKSIDNKSGVSEIVSIVKNVLTGNAKISAEGNTRTITLSGDAAGNYISEIITGVIKSDYMKNMLSSMNEALGESELYDISDEDIKEVTDVIKALKIFADDAVSIKITLDKDGYIKEADEKVHFAFNIAELCESFEIGAEDIYPLTKENSEVDFTLAAKATYHRVNNVTVTMPSMTEEKTVDLTQVFASQPEPDYDYDYGYEDWEEYWYRTQESFTDYFDIEEPNDISKAEFYVSLESFFEATSWDDDSLTGSVILGEDGSITVEYESKALEKTVLTAKLGETAYSVNGAVYEAKRPFKLLPYESEYYDWEADEYKTETLTGVFVSCDVLEALFGCKVESYTVYLGGEAPKYSVALKRPNPGYDPDYVMGEEMDY